MDRTRNVAEMIEKSETGIENECIVGLLEGEELLKGDKGNCTPSVLADGL